jgi:excisionase family DNA binding protein
MPVRKQPLATSDDVAEYLVVSPRTLDDWASRGTGPVFARVGGQRRYRWQDVENWVDERTSADAPSGDAA